MGVLPEVVLIGDSIRMGYQRVVERELAGIARIWHPGENCGTSANILENLDEWVILRGPSLVHLNCGLHDLKIERPATQQQVPLPQYRSNLAQILWRIISCTPSIVVWASTTPVNEEWHQARKGFGFDRYEADVEKYNQAGIEIARRCGAVINDLYQFVVRQGCDAMLCPDGVHYKQSGYRRLGKAVASVIREQLALKG